MTDSIYIYFSFLPRMTFLGHVLPLCLIFWGISRVSTSISIPFYIPTSTTESSDFATSSPIPLVISCLFAYSHPSECKVLCPSCLNLHCLRTVMLNIFSYAFGRLYILIGEVSILIFCSFKNWVNYPFIASCKYSVYILDRNLIRYMIHVFFH